MTRNKKKLLSAGVFVFAVLFANFIYNNVIVPLPFREELKVCLLDARSLDNQAEIDAAENVCFRIYPHFN